MLGDILLPDNELVILLRSGDRQSFSEIYSRYWQKLYNTAYKRLRDKEYCKDIVQAVFADLWKRRAEVLIKDLPAYLHTAVRFQVLKHISNKPSPGEFLDEFGELISSSVNTDDALMEKEILALIKLWVDALPAKRRAIFLMYVNEELSTREIAGRLGIAQKTVQNQLNTAMTAIRARLAQMLILLIVTASAIE